MPPIGYVLLGLMIVAVAAAVVAWVIIITEGDGRK